MARAERVGMVGVTLITWSCPWETWAGRGRGLRVREGRGVAGVGSYALVWWCSGACYSPPLVSSQRSGRSYGGASSEAPGCSTQAPRHTETGALVQALSGPSRHLSGASSLIPVLTTNPQVSGHIQREPGHLLHTRRGSDNSHTHNLDYGDLGMRPWSCGGERPPRLDGAADACSARHSLGSCNLREYGHRLDGAAKPTTTEQCESQQVGSGKNITSQT
jgi:hypothetical protein